MEKHLDGAKSEILQCVIFSLEKWKKEKEMENLVPTVDLLIEELTEHVNEKK